MILGIFATEPLTVKNLGYDNKRLHVKKGQPQEWRESFAEELRKQGIEAEATPRSVRGVVKKGINQAVKYIRVEKRESFTDKAKIKEVVNEYENKNSAEKPWESKIKERQNIIRRGWLNQAKDLKEKGEDELSKSIVNFVQEMPPLKTERHEIKEHIAKHYKEKSKDTKNNEQEER